MIYAIDFDGTLCTNAWPDIGEPNIAFIRHFRELREQGHKLILWTCREGEALQRAIDWCADYGLGFDAHNENLPELNELYGNDCRKIGADFYVDDKSYWPIGKESKMNADEVVSALRCCNRSKGHRCSVCPVFSRYEHRICKATVDRFAADLIESLQAELTDYHHMSELVDGKMKENQRLRRINENLQEQLAASQRREKAALITDR